MAETSNPLEIVVYNERPDLLGQTLQSIGNVPHIIIEADEAADELEAFRLSKSRVSGRFIWFLQSGDYFDSPSDFTRAQKTLAGAEDGLFAVRTLSEEYNLNYKNNMVQIDLENPETARLFSVDFGLFCIPYDEYVSLEPDDEVPEEALTRAAIALLIRYKKYTKKFSRACS